MAISRRNAARGTPDDSGLLHRFDKGRKGLTHKELDFKLEALRASTTESGSSSTEGQCHSDCFWKKRAQETDGAISGPAFTFQISGRFILRSCTSVWV